MSKKFLEAPPAPAEDFLLPYFLKDEEKFIDLMHAVSSVLDAYPGNMTRRHWEELNEAFHQVKRGPHPYEAIKADQVGTWKAFGFSADLCMWCSKDHPSDTVG